MVIFKCNFHILSYLFHALYIYSDSFSSLKGKEILLEALQLLTFCVSATVSVQFYNMTYNVKDRHGRKKKTFFPPW